MRSNDEYLLSRAIASYLKWKHPEVVFKFDVTGLNLSMAQAGMNKAIQQRKGWPDLMIFEPRGDFSGLFIELKKDGTKIVAARASDAYGYPKYSTPHIAEQAECMAELAERGYYTAFACGYDSAINVIEKYLKL
jgi:hypothetical protein